MCTCAHISIFPDSSYNKLQEVIKIHFQSIPSIYYSVTLWTPQFTTLYIIHILWCGKHGNGHVLIPGTCEYMKWHDSGKLRLSISWPEDGEMDYPHEPRQSQGPHEWRRQEGKREPERQMLETGSAWPLALKMGEGAMGQGMQGPLKAGRGRE